MTTVYRFFDAHGDLLYVGIANSVIHRISQHITSKEWFQTVASAKFEHLETRAEAEARERHIIQSERPRYNVRGTLVGATPITITIDGAHHEALKALAEQEDCSLAHLIRDAIAAFLRDKNREAA